MNMLEILYHKRDGGKLSKEQIDFFVSQYTKGAIPDYQASALLMAIFFRDLDREETYWLTRAMMESGEILDLADIPGIKVDKHSTGGVGDKTTLIVGPLCASCGVPVAKMSGRGLGFTGGTVDKLEAIPGFQTTLSQERFRQVVRETGICVIGQSQGIAAADKKLYALRDVTATVDNKGLITASIMSKKLAAGSDGILLDVKCGQGAFMKNLEDARKLARAMVEIGKTAGKQTAAFVTDMSQPLGRAVGNASEVMEAIRTLRGQGPEDITLLAKTLAGYMVFMGGKASSHEEGMKKVEDQMKNGGAVRKLKEMILAQGGDGGVVEDFSLFPQPAFRAELKGEETGFVESIRADVIGSASQISGAGREKKEDAIDLSAGIYLHKKVGEPVEKGETLAVVFGNDREKLSLALEKARLAYDIAEKPVKAPELIKELIC